MAELDGPRLGAKNAKAGGKVKQLVVLLHGYGADGKDLIALGQQWQALLPDAAFVAPNAPEPCAQAPMGRQWFALTMRDPNERWVGVNTAAPVLDAFLDSEMASHGLTDDKLALVGFSQGTMMALHVGLRRRHSPAAIVGLSGTLVGPEHLAAIAPKKPPPILLTHGATDEVIPADAMFIAAEDLAEVGIPAQWHISANVGHGIDGAAMTHAGLFLAKAFGLRTPAMPPAPR